MSIDKNRNIYKGHRYVPLIDGEWDKNKSYEGLTVVTYQGASYTSKKHVPAGIDINNKEYWSLTGNYNAQIESYRRDVRDMEDNVNNKMDQTVDYVNKELVSVNKQIAETDDFRHFESPINRREPGLLISWVDDDGHSLVYNRFKPILQDYNIPITSALVTSRLDGRMNHLNEEQRKELQELGMEFISHSHLHDVNHKPDDMTEEELEYDFSTSKELLKKHGYNYRGIAIPFASLSDLTIKVANRYFDYVIGTTRGGVNAEAQIPGELSNKYLWRVSVENGFDYVKERIDRAKEVGTAWLILGSHIYYDWYSDSLVRQIINYAIANGFEFVTTYEGIRRMGNVSEFGQSKITSEGKFVGGVSVEQNLTGITGNTPIYDFPKRTITHTAINVNHIDGIPGKTSGVLITHRMHEDLYSYQEFISTRRKHEYIRYWNTDNDEWSEWKISGASSYLGVNQVKADDNPFEHRRIPYGKTYTYIDSNEMANFPRNTPGLLTTIAFRETSITQIYEPKHSDIKYERYWLEDKWSDWIKKDIVRGIEFDTSRPPASYKADEFDEGITTAFIHGGYDLEGLPNKVAGTLITYRLSLSQGRAYQEYHKLRTYDKYIRYEDENGNWSDWKKFVLE